MLRTLHFVIGLIVGLGGMSSAFVSGYEKTGTAYMTGEVAKRYLQDLTSFSEAFPKLL